MKTIEHGAELDTEITGLMKQHNMKRISDLRNVKLVVQAGVVVEKK